MLFQDLGYHSVMVRHFQESDSDQDGFLDSLEWLRYIKKAKNKGSHDEDEDEKELDSRK